MNRSIVTNSKLIVLGAVCAVIIFALYSSLQLRADQNSAAPTTSADASDGLQGEIVYIPIYSSIYFENGKRTLELAATLAIHNVDPEHSITITRADYFNSEGKLIKKYLEKPLTLGPLQTSNIVINRLDTSGGTGANFLVDWQTKQHAASPLIEAVMVNASSNLGIAFTSTGKVVRKTGSN